jgi:hypothetical protein
MSKTEVVHWRFECPTHYLLCGAWVCGRDVYEKYQLHDDPFTHLPCTSKEYGELCEEYGRQKFEEYWGYPYGH